MVEVIQFEYRYGRNEKAKQPDDEHNEDGLLEFALQAQRKHDGQVTIDGDVGEDEDRKLGGERTEEAGELAKMRGPPVRIVEIVNASIVGIHLWVAGGDLGKRGA